jgi:hypothetical protein
MKSLLRIRVDGALRKVRVSTVLFSSQGIEVGVDEVLIAFQPHVLTNVTISSFSMKSDIAFY